MRFTHINSLAFEPDPRPNEHHLRTTPTPINICTASRRNPYLQEARNATVAQVAAGWSSRIEEFLRTETWRRIEAIFNGPPQVLQRLSRIDKIVGFGLGNLTTSAVGREGERPEEEGEGFRERRSCMQHALLVSLADLLEARTGSRVRRVVQEPAYLDTCKGALSGRGVEVVERDDGFLLVDERTLVFAVSCNVPVRQIVADLARPVGMIWDRVEPEDKSPPEWEENEDGGLVSPYTTDYASSRVCEMVQEYTEHLLPEEDADFLGHVGVYVRKEVS
ncbi:hypothetical protein JDV02_008475 [Purpureocillium takamizusanense]|uniref:SRR1-like domain-containing protein n=1 Tax=Purpureocillium takamizusanense TaxID=2060973 RepID=A0A9Q8QM60_9HYPO|nr:uncharacterized protein JDV02_008475 [Purpureocillium takamizusanense]UNI22603.1 hypothetical protein JDV02_008475 [Purpureocillium takamizusanense]